MEATNKIMVEDVVISDFSGLNILLHNQPSFIDNIKYFILMNSATTHLNIGGIINRDIKTIIKNSKKFYLLVEPYFYTGSEEHFLFKDRVINCSRGFYFDKYKKIKKEIPIWYCHKLLMVVTKRK